MRSRTVTFPIESRVATAMELEKVVTALATRRTDPSITLNPGELRVPVGFFSTIVVSGGLVSNYEAKGQSPKAQLVVIRRDIEEQIKGITAETAATANLDYTVEVETNTVVAALKKLVHPFLYG